MGHIVKIREQIDITENELKRSSTKSPSRVRFQLNSSPPSPSDEAATAATTPQHPPKATPSRSAAPVGTSWQDCMQGIVNLLPMPYSEHWIGSLDHLLHGDGPLPESWRIYIAIMGLCRHEVTWVVRALTLEFLAVEGDRRWLCGLKYAPGKLRALSEINNILAHRPWLLTSKDIQALIKGEESWSLAEICQAICLLTHFHALASFMHSCLPFLHNCSPLQPPSPGHANSSSTSSSKNSPSKANPSTLSNGESLPIVELFQIQSHKLEDISLDSVASKTPNGSTPTCGATTVTPSKTLEEAGSGAGAGAFVNGASSVPVSSSAIAIPQNGFTESPEGPKGTPNSILKILGFTPSGSKREIQASPQPSKQSKSESHTMPCYPAERVASSPVREYSYLCVDLSFTYQELPSSSQLKSNILKIREFNWLDHGYSLMSRILTDLCKMLDERFRSIKTLTHPSWDSEDRCPLQVRTAVWNFIQSLFGIHHDEYNYDLLKKFLSEDILAFVKKATCWPESLEGKIPASLTKSSSNAPSEVIPLSIVIMEGRLQSELLYALKAIIPNQC